ncbi:MAG: hypothetical protein SVK44_08020 [Nitrospirota bacterium]|nr:hypothetical protein [Nitrospirota bacterium]
MGANALGPYADFLSPQFLMQSVPISLDMVPPSINIASGSPYALFGLPEQFMQSMHVAMMDLQTLPGGIDYLSWLISTFLQAFGIYW